MSENGERVAFLAGVRGVRTAFVDERPLDFGADWIVEWPLAMSADGGTIACALRNSRTGKGRVAVNGRLGPEFDAVGALALSRDGKALAYRAREGGETFVVSGEQRGPSFEELVDPAVSADGAAVLYAGARGGKWVLVRGDRETSLEERPFSVFAGPGGRRVGYVALEPAPGGGTYARAVVDGARGEAFGLVGRIVFGPGTYAYAADEGDKRYVVVGARRYEAEGRVTDPVFSPDGRRVGYGARIGREFWWKVLELK